MTHREWERGVEGREKKEQEAICMQRQRVSPLLQSFVSACSSPSKSSPHYPAFSHFSSYPSLSSTFLPLSFALRLAATADLNNSAQAGILQGPIVCAWQENEKERDKERKEENREKGALQGSVSACVCVHRGVCVCVNGRKRERKRGRGGWEGGPSCLLLPSSGVNQH